MFKFRWRIYSQIQSNELIPMRLFFVDFFFMHDEDDDRVMCKNAWISKRSINEDLFDIADQ